MSDIYFFAVSVERKEGFSLYRDLEEVVAHCFVKSVDPISSCMRADFFLKKDGWEPCELQLPPVKIYGRKDFDDEYFSEAYEKSLKQGVAIIYKAKSREVSETTVSDAVREKKVNPSKFHEVSARLRNRKVCYHPEAGEKCDNVIRAHSIQKSRGLKSISKNGHVYRLSHKPQEDGAADFKLMGVEKASTFQGFCKTHDNELFELIDNNDFDFSHEQAFLYSYRSICRELYVKENQETLMNEMRDHFEDIGDDHLFKTFSELSIGAGNGLRSLNKTKMKYDQVFIEQSYGDVEWVALHIRRPPSFMFSGLIYPDFDFLGRKLQEINDFEAFLSLVTFCSAPCRKGWMCVFSWHKDHADIGRKFIGSLAVSSESSSQAIGDSLFRLVISGCDNLVIAPDWWGEVGEEEKEKIIGVFSNVGSPMTLIDESYLKGGLEGISGWEVDEIYQSF